MKHRQANIRKAAILLASLDGPLANQLAGQLPPSQMELVRQAMEGLGEIDPAEQQEVIDEFFRIGPTTPENEPEGIELGGTLAETLAIAGSNGVDQRPTTAAAGLQPFHFLHNADVPSLVPFLEKERPQTIAIVLAYLPQDRAAQILTALRPKLQVEVLQRLADLDVADAESLRVVEHELESWVRQQSRQQERRQAGLTTARGIVSAAGSLGEQIILENLRQHDDRLAKKIGGDRREVTTVPVLRWDDLADLDEESISAMVREAEPELLVLALASADQRLMERALEQLSKQDADALVSRIAQLGPTRLSDVEAAQQELVALATQWTRVREVVLPRSRLTIAA